MTHKCPTMARKLLDSAWTSFNDRHESLDELPLRTSCHYELVAWRRTSRSMMWTSRLTKHHENSHDQHSQNNHYWHGQSATKSVTVDVVQMPNNHDRHGLSLTKIITVNMVTVTINVVYLSLKQSQSTWSIRQSWSTWSNLSNSHDQHGQSATKTGMIVHLHS